MSVCRLLILIVLCSLFFSVLHFAQSQSHFTHLTTDNGLSQSSVFNIVQDKIGFMWFATEDGLNRFDGNKFIVYRNKPDDSTSIQDLGIRKVFKDKTGELWILTLRGRLSRFIQTKNNFKRYSFSDDKSFSQIKIITLAEDAKGNLWAASSKFEFFLYNSEKDSFITKEFDNSLKKIFESVHVQCLLGDSDGTLWIGTWEGLINLNPVTQKYSWYKNSSDPNSLGGNLVFNLAEDHSGNIWIASANGGVSVFNKSTSSFKVYKNIPGRKNSLSSNRIVSILIDSRNKIWIGTFDKGLDLFIPGTESFINFSHNPSVSTSISIGAVMSIYEDKSGGIWFGTGGGGINRYEPLNQNFNHIQHIPGNPSSISPNPVLAICEDHLGNLWIGSDGGGINFKEKKSNEFKSFLQNPVFGSNAITVIYEDSKGNIWIGADPGVHSPGGVVIQYERNTKKFTPVNNIKIKLGGVSVIREDRYGELWIATPTDGVHRYNTSTGKEIIYKTNPADTTTISSNSIFSIYEDCSGDLWFGSIATGLNLFDRKKNSFIRFTNDLNDKTSIGSNSIWCITEDADKNLWIGTWGNGLNKFERDKKRFIHYTVDDGLPGNVVYGIIPDDQGNLWLSSNHGITKFNPVNGMIKNYDKSNGLLISDFSAGAVFKSKDGRLFFGGSSGAVSFDPKSIKNNTYLPNVVITDFRVFDKPFNANESILFKKEIQLNYDQNFFTIEFASLDFTSPENNVFEYKLEGVDKNWVNSGSRNFASYTDINHGHYKFMVRGSNSSGVFNPVKAVLGITIAPPFWKTWWFRTTAVIVLVLMLYSIHRYRLNKLLEVERTRNRIAKDLHDDVSATLTGIVYFSDAISKELGEQKTPLVQKLISLIHESASDVQESMSDIIWAINPDNDDWSKILPRFRRYASDLCESKSIKYFINIGELPQKFKKLPMERRRNLWLIYKEIITNAVKHSGCSLIEINIEFNENEFLLSISDNGSGFDKNLKSEGNGLKNIYSRIESLNGKIELQTIPGSGTKWKLKFTM